MNNPGPQGCLVYGPYAPLPSVAEVSADFGFYSLGINTPPGQNPKVLDLQITAEGGSILLATRTLFAQDLGKCSNSSFMSTEYQICYITGQSTSKIDGVVHLQVAQSFGVSSGLTQPHQNIEMRICNVNAGVDLKLMTSVLKFRTESR